MSSFPWDKVMAMFPKQKKTFDDLKVQLSGDSYFGFTEEASKFGVAHYPDLYYIARKLLIEHMGDKNLERHKAKSTPTDYPLVEALLRKFKAKAEVLVMAKAEKVFEEMEKTD